MGTTDVQERESPVLYEVRGHVALLTLNRPHAMNAVNGALATALGTALERVAADDHIRAVVLTGAGRAFCAGMDLKAFAKGETVDPARHPEWGFGGMVRHFIDKPLIAAVNGFALGGGTELALTCDLIVADENAAFGLPEVTRGLFAAAGGLLRLGQLIPQKLAMQLALTGQPITAEQAHRWGLVNQVAPAGTAVETAMDLAEVIAGNAPLAVQASKRLIHRTAHESSWSEEPWVWNGQEEAFVFSSDDAKEGAQAFTEKRTPMWQAR